MATETSKTHGPYRPQSMPLGRWTVIRQPRDKRAVPTVAADAPNFNTFTEAAALARKLNESAKS